MRVLTIVHDLDAGPGVFNDVFDASGAAVGEWLISEQPEPPAAVRDYDAILAFGGAAHPDQEQRHPWLVTEKRFLAEALEARVPLLGVCLGAQLLAEAQGAPTRRMARAEIGWYDVELSADAAADPVLGPIGGPFAALEWHSYEVELPAGATALARSPNCLQSYRIGDFAWGIQFHAEVTAADFQLWLDDFGSDPEAVAAGIDTDAITRENEARIAAWHELGRGICARFLQVAGER